MFQEVMKYIRSLVTITELGDYIQRVALHQDRQAYSVLFDHYAPLIRAYSLAREPGSNLVADDLAQEVMIRLWLKASSYNPKMANLNTWVFTLARNCRIDYLRKNSRYVTDIDPDVIFNELEDDAPNPFQQVHSVRMEQSIHSSLKQLPKEQTEVLSKVYMEGKSHQQVSSELKLPLGTVKSRVRLALKKLDGMLGGFNE
jgi:RNA polymerase sigma factor (sigma-70 family)